MCVTMVVTVMLRVTSFFVIFSLALMRRLAMTMRMNAKNLKPCMAQNGYWNKRGEQ